MAIQWEYMTTKKFRDANELGRQGWELVQALHLGKDEFVFFFKRPLR